MSVPSRTDGPLEQFDFVHPGRSFPYVTGGEWVLLAPLPATSKTLYFLLRGHVNHKRGDGRAWPIQDDLAAFLGLKKPEQVKRYTDPLVEIGAVDIERVRYANGLRQRIIYTVHESPPEGYDGWTSFAAYYSSKRETAGQPDPPKMGGRSTPNKGGRDTPYLGGEPPEVETRGEEEDAREAPSSASSVGAGGGPAAVAAAQEPVWGARGGRVVGVSMESVETIRTVAEAALRTGTELEPGDHQDLAGRLEEITPVVERTAGVSWEDFTAYLHQGWWKEQTPQFDDFVAVMRARLTQGHITSRVVPWAVKRRAKEAEAPPVTDQSSGDPFAGTVPRSEVCPVHRTLYGTGGRCAECEVLPPPARREETSSSTDTVEEPPSTEELAAELEALPAASSLTGATVESGSTEVGIPAPIGGADLRASAFRRLTQGG